MAPLRGCHLGYCHGMSWIAAGAPPCVHFLWPACLWMQSKARQPTPKRAAAAADVHHMLVCFLCAVQCLNPFFLLPGLCIMQCMCYCL